MLSGISPATRLLAIVLLIVLFYYLICDSVVTETNVTTIMKCLVCHNMAHDILIGHRFRQLQILLLQLHIREQMAIGCEFGAMLAV